MASSDADEAPVVALPLKSAMTSDAVALVAAAVLALGVWSARLERAELTAPIVFVSVDVVLHAVTPLDPGLAPGIPTQATATPNSRLPGRD